MTMTEVAIAQITRELQLTKRQVQATVELLDSGATVPFIALTDEAVKASGSESPDLSTP